MVREEYPELEKMRAAKATTQPAGEFLDWLLTKYSLVIWNGERAHPVSRTIEQLLADWAGVDLDKVEAERRAILDDIRAARATGGTADENR